MRSTHLLVCFIVEILEQEEEHARMHSDPPYEWNWIIAWIVEEKLECVNHHGNELHHLQKCQVFLPPEIGLHLWSDCGKHIVEVHDDVNEDVEEAEEGRVAAWRELDAPPNCRRSFVKLSKIVVILRKQKVERIVILTAKWHDSMMNHMQSWNLIVSFSHDKEESIEEFSKFAEEIPPASCGHLRAQ